MRRTRFYRPVLLLGLFFLLGLLFVPECDDCYFVYWEYDSLKNFLLTHPIPEDMHAYGVPANGRYLGNLIGVLQGKLYFTPFGWLRGLFMGGVLAGMTLLLGRRFAPDGERKGEGFALAFSLVALAPRGLWQQVYSWGAAFVNYLLPMAGILILLALLSKKRPAPAVCFLVSLCCCFFMEPVTILMCLGGITYGGYALLKERERLPGSLAAALGAVLGTVLMFSNPGYTQIGSDNRALGLELISRNLTFIATEALLRPVAAALLISFLLVWLLRRQGGVWQPWAVLLAPIHMFCVVDALRDCAYGGGLQDMKRMMLAGALALIWLVLLAQWKGGAARVQVAAGALALCVVNGPLLVVSPVESRALFPSYVVLLIIAALLWREARKQGLRLSMRWAWVPGAVVCALLIGVYSANFLVYHQRLDSARLQVAQGARELTLPLVPFTGWTVNEQRNKGDICFLVYRDTAWDVPVQFVPYREFIS